MLRGKKFDIPEQVALLLQKALEAMKEVSAAGNAPTADQGKSGAKGVSSLEQISHMSKPAHVGGAESSHQGVNQPPRKENSDKISYCFRCKTKGHAIESCKASMYCIICDSRDQFKPHCTMYRTVKQGAAPCGFAVEGLGFFHISHDIGGRTCPDA
jgi:hypothetical protein